jgi:6-phosphogluconate dehydrogenase (decarboxylating)
MGGNMVTRLRFWSRIEDTYSDKMLAMMRNQFGGHAVLTTRP